jgi:hypothetical protein
MTAATLAGAVPVTTFRAGEDVAARLRAAAAALAAGDGTEPHVWRLPPGEVRLPAGTVLGAAGRDVVVEATGTVLVVDVPATGTGTALRLLGRRVRLSGGTVRASGAGPVVALAVDAEASRLEGLRIEGARGDDVTALAVRGGRTRIAGLDVLDLRGASLARALDVDVLDSAEVLGARLRGLHGRRVAGLLVRASAGSVRDVLVDDLRPGEVDGLTTVSVAGALEVAGVGAVRDLATPPGDPLAALAAAQAALAATPPGTVETWLLPAGTLTPAGGLALGVPGRGLRLRGRRPDGGGGATELRVGVGAPLGGDAVALALAGSEVGVAELVVRAEATGALTAVRLAAPRAEAADLDLRGLRGASVVGLDVAAGTGEAGVVDLRVEDVVADGAATGALVRCGRAVLTQVRAAGLSAGGHAAGVVAAAGAALAASGVRASAVHGATATGVRLRLDAPEADAAGELSALEVVAQDVVASAGDATGVAILTAGDLAARGLRASAVRGGRATGALLAATGEVDWQGGTIADVAGTGGGAAGARVLARPSPSAVRVEAVAVEAVGGTAPGGEARPPRSWADLLLPGRDGWLTGEDDALPEPGGPAHAEDVAGLALVVPAGEGEAAAPGGRLAGDVGVVEVRGISIRRVSGTALQVEAEGRSVLVRGAEAWTAARGGWVDGDDVLLAELTWHRVRTGIEVGPAMVRVVDVLLTDVEDGLPLVGADRGDDALGSFTGRAGPGGAFRVAPLELAQAADLDDAEPASLYVRPGPADPLPAAVLAGAVAPAADVDLHLVPGHPLHLTAERVPGDEDDAAAHVGAWPDTAAPCTLRDPLARPTPDPAPPLRPGPLVDYLARDAESLLTVMVDRARVVMPDWPADSPADLTRMLLELLANRLDRLAYRQEAAVAEGYLGSARLRRSVEDHARLVDYRPDPGLSATAMLRVDVADVAARDLDLPAAGTAFTVPRDTVVVNRDATLEAVVFATEEDLPVDLRLRSVALAGDVRRGATSAELAGALDVPAGRWLVLAALDPTVPAVPGEERLDPSRPGHVVRVTRAEVSGGTTRVFWDFRRAAPADFPASASRVLGNVVPAHHGTPLTPGTDGWGGLGDVLRPWREQLAIDVDNADGTVREIALPAGPVSVHAPGWPLPGEEGARHGALRLAVLVDGEEWTLVDSLTDSGPSDEHVVARAGDDGAPLLRFGDGVSGAALPRRVTRLEVAMRIGVGARANVGAGVLTQVLSFGERGDLPEVLPAAPERLERIAAGVRVGNPLPALGGRDAEPLDRIRRRAPLAARAPGSAVVPADYELLVAGRADVAGARARFRPTALRDVVEVTALLAGEDELTAAGEAGTAERLRRWAAIRAALEAARLLGTDVELLPPAFVPLDVDLEVDAEPTASAEQVRVDVTEALAGPGGLLDPDTAGLGGDVRVDDVYRHVLRVPGVAGARVLRLRRLVPGSPETAVDGVLPVAAGEVAVLRDPLGRPGRDGVLTVTVCGGRG